MPEAQLTEPLDRAAEKGGLEGLEEMFAALEAAVKADSRRRLISSRNPAGDPPPPQAVVLCHRRELDGAAVDELQHPAIVNAFTTVNPETDATVRAVDYQVVGAPPDQFPPVFGRRTRRRPLAARRDGGVTVTPDQFWTRPY